MSTIEIELSDRPEAPKHGPTATPVTRGIAALAAAATWSDLESVVAGLRALPEADKVKLRPYLKINQERVRAAVAPATAAVSIPGTAPAAATGAIVAEVTAAEPPTPTVTLERAAASLADIAAESVTNAAVPTGGSMATGEMAGVGFTSAEGYLRALRNGTKAHTRAEYVRILSERYHQHHNAESFPLIPESGPIDTAPIVHTPTGPSVWDLPRAERAKLPAIPQVRTVPTAPVREQITAKNMVAGARETATGVFLGWAGANEVPVEIIRGALVDAGCDPGWAPTNRSAHFHASEALKPLQSNGRVVRSERGGTRQMASLIAGRIPRRYSAAWTVLRPTHSDVGEKAGVTCLRVQLATNGELEIEALEGHETDRERVMADYWRRCSQEVLPAGDVTKWLRDLLISRFRAVRVGGMWYVPAKHAAAAEGVCTAIARTGFGTDWVLPALPVSTGEALKSALVRGFTSEVSALLVELQEERDRAVANKRPDIGGKGAANYLARLREVNERAKAYRELLGEEFVAPVSKAIKDAITVLEPLCDDTAQRFAALEAY